MSAKKKKGKETDEYTGNGYSSVAPPVEVLSPTEPAPPPPPPPKSRLPPPAPGRIDAYQSSLSFLTGGMLKKQGASLKPVKNRQVKSKTTFKDFEDDLNAERIGPESWCQGKDFQLGTLASYFAQENNFTSDSTQTLLIDFSGVEPLSDICLYLVVVVMKNRKKMDGVKAIQLGGCYNLSDAGLSYIAALFPSLVTISLSGYDNFTEKGVAQLIVKLPKLQAIQYQGGLITTKGLDKALVKFPTTINIDESPLFVPLQHERDHENNKHVMISYHRDSQETVLWVKDRLKEAGYKVWMDVDNMEGSILEASMASAVENAAVVIVCVSQKYKDSKNCRTEAQYALELKKKVIPLKLQKDYTADGWLGFMVGSMLYFDFSNQDTWSRTMPDLCHELENLGKLNPDLGLFNLSYNGPSLDRDDIDTSSAIPTHHKAVIIGEGDILALLTGNGDQQNKGVKAKPLASILDFATSEKIFFNIYECLAVYSDLCLSDCCICVLPYDSGKSLGDNAGRITAIITQVGVKYNDVSFLLVGTSKNGTVNTNGQQLKTTIQEQLSEQAAEARRRIEDLVTNLTTCDFEEQRNMDRALSLLSLETTPIEYVDTSSLDGEASRDRLKEALQSCAQSFLEVHKSYSDVVKRKMSYYESLVEVTETVNKGDPIYDVFGLISRDNFIVNPHQKQDGVRAKEKLETASFDILNKTGKIMNFKFQNSWYFTPNIEQFLGLIIRILTGIVQQNEPGLDMAQNILQHFGMIQTSLSHDDIISAPPTCSLPLEHFWNPAREDNEAEVYITFSCIQVIDNSVLFKLSNYLRPYVFMTFDKAVLLENFGVDMLIEIDNKTLHVKLRCGMYPDQDNKDSVSECLWHTITRFNTAVQYALANAGLFYQHRVIQTDLPKPANVIGLIEEHNYDDKDNTCVHCGLSSTWISHITRMNRRLNPLFFGESGLDVRDRQSSPLKHSNVLKYPTKSTAEDNVVRIETKIGKPLTVEIYVNSTVSINVTNPGFITTLDSFTGHCMIHVSSTWQDGSLETVSTIFRNGVVVKTARSNDVIISKKMRQYKFTFFEFSFDDVKTFWKVTVDTTLSTPPAIFEKGLKLEAQDFKNPSRVGVATARRRKHDKLFTLTVKFDDSNETQQFLEDYHGLHPIGWFDSLSKEDKKRLNLEETLYAIPPQKNGETFNWATYLKERKAIPVPYEFFTKEQTMLCPKHPSMPATEFRGRPIGQGCPAYLNQLEVWQKNFQSTLLTKQTEKQQMTFLNGASLHIMLPEERLTESSLTYPSMKLLRSLTYLQPVCYTVTHNATYQNIHAPCSEVKKLTNEEAKKAFLGSWQTIMSLVCLRQTCGQFRFLPTKWTPGSGLSGYTEEKLEEALFRMFARMVPVLILFGASNIDGGSKDENTKPFLCEYHANIDKVETHEQLNLSNEYHSVIHEVVLNHKGFKTFPDEIFFGYSNLVHLNLSHNHLTKIPSLEKCVALKDLLLGFNELSVVPPIDQWPCFSTISKLDVSHNPIIELPSFIYELPKLDHLNVEDIGLQKLDEKIGNLGATLKYLNLSSNGISQLPSGVKDLVLLEHLNLAGVKWIELDETSQPSLQALETFLLESTTAAILFKQKPGLAQEMIQQCDVKHRGTLDFKEIQELNVKLFNLFPRLGRLLTTGSDMPPQINSLKALHHLVLSHQGLSNIPEEIESLENLETVDFSSNPLLEAVHGNLSQLPLKALSLKNCPMLKTPPREIVHRGLHPIMGYLRRLLTGSVSCKETKLMLVGLGGAGKTSLVNTLTGANNKSGETPDVTDGIDIAPWTVHLDSYGQDGQLTFSVWDFAGQTVYYNTHQFFLSDRAVYLLVWNMRLGYEHAGLDFWLSSINSHAPKAPILVVGTHADQVVRSDLPVKKMKKRFPQITGFHYVSCHTGLNTDELRQNLIETALQEKYMGELIPAVWVKLRNKIVEVRQQRNLSLMEFSELSDLAVNVGIVDKEELMNAVGFLNDLGTIQRFSNQFLKSKVVVNPQWIVDVMSCVVNVFESPIKEGRFLHSDVQVIWDRYPAEQHQFLLRLTEEFDLTFPLKGQNANLVPCLLPDAEPEYSWPELGDSKDVQETKMIYMFDYLPSGLFNRAQVRLYHFCDDSSLIWKTGSVLKKGGQIALVKQMTDAVSQLEVKVQGSHPKNMLYLIHDVFETLVRESFHGVHYDYQIPCMDCMKTTFYMEPCMFSASKVRRATELKAVFLQCDQYFHTLSLTELHSAMPPDNSKDFDMQIERTVNDLKNLRLDMSTDFFMLYCNGDIPKGELITHVDPKRIRDDLKKAGHKVWWSDNIQSLPAETVTMAMKDARAVIVLISKNFVKDTFCIDTLYRVRESLHKEVLLVVIGSGWQNADAGFLTSDDVYIDMSRLELYDSKFKELEQAIKKRFSEEQEEIFPECFISYCWSNSRKAVEQGTPEVRDALGWGDPRDLKEMLEKTDIPCWMDIERVGTTGGLFEDIAKGLRKAKVVVACVSDQYAESRNCQMEFRFAVKVLKLPVILAVVGQGVKWNTSEVGMLAFDLPRVSLMNENQAALEELVQMVKTHMPVTPGVDRPISRSEHKQFALNELMELAQRNFLRQLAGFADSMESSPYPRLFVLDFLDKTEKTPKTEDGAVRGREHLCIRILCENEECWHTSGVAIPLSSILPPMQSIDECLMSVAAYMFRMMTILKHSTVDLDIFYEFKGKEIFKSLEQLASADPEFKSSYTRLRKLVMAHDVMEVMGDLDRCHLRSGNIIWLCKEHQQSIGDVTILEKEEGVATVGTGESESKALSEGILKSLGLAPKAETVISEFTSKTKAKGKLMGAATAARIIGRRTALGSENSAALKQAVAGSGKSVNSKACLLQ